VIEQGVAL
jgi:hypothetical protein